MTKKDFTLIANAIGRTQMASNIGKKKRTPDEVLSLLVTDLAASLKADNPRFDEDRFRAACGL